MLTLHRQTFAVLTKGSKFRGQEMPVCLNQGLGTLALELGPLPA